MKNYQIGLYEKSMPNEMSLREKLDTAKKAGFDYLEISIDETDEKLARLDSSISEFKEMLNDIIQTDFPIRSMCLSGHRKYPLGTSDSEKEKRSLDIMLKAVKMAYVLGIRTIQLAGYDVYYEESSQDTKDRFLTNLRKAVDMASEYGVILGFETMETPFMDTVHKAMYYVNKIDSPYLQVYPDCGNLTNASKIYKTSVKDDILSGKGHIVALHLKETLPGKYREIPFGTGHVDFDEIIKTSTNIGVRRFVTELWKTDDNWYDSIVFARKMMSEKIEKYL
ncbi:L-ribulose-5-phosphate 3-epimerase [Criibacterium bergeronii]|uniref:L-ribulose-5-phosphate 3-epimerase n=1 Tax=Criibacterium bergeronii TaxID=1871336 RepID=A0A552VE18_9FIRM|nr:L-ribulose-5-phosphate 3-epimerase [Criibacterium bergeronii]TRW28721.1 L-ribulose-5-phosphate 3-epimerase [Criibacterium bergeronii]